MTAKKWLLLAIGAGAIAFYVFPDWFEMIVGLIFGGGTLAGMTAKRQIKDAKEDAVLAQQDIAETDKEIKKVRANLTSAIEEQQELGITIHGKLSEEQKALAEEKQKIKNESIGADDAIAYIRNQLNERKL